MIRGGLFTRFFLEDGIRTTQPYDALRSADIEAFARAARERWSALEQMRRPSEAETEAEFIYPLFALLGWEHLPQQEPGRGRRDIADALLFTSLEKKAEARAQPASADRFRHGAVVVENEARDTPLDRASGQSEAPSSQILRYLSRAETQSGSAVRWGLLTNGQLWRLYWSGARTRAEGFVELDLPGIFGTLPPPAPPNAPSDHWLRVFLLLFRRDALLENDVGGKTFLEYALDEGRRYERRITASLSTTIFESVYPALVSAIHAQARPAADSADRMAEIREAALRLLYRLLFVFYAEDRDLLPIRLPAYDTYSLRTLRHKAADLADTKRTLSARAQSWWQHLATLFAAISEGDAQMGLPPYNGGLFSASNAGLLAGVTLPDATIAPLIEAMSREGEADARQWINYRDLSVQQLGSIYECLLERDPVLDGSGGVTLRPNRFARKTTGSYYTPDELVMLILRRTVGPLLDERRAGFTKKADDLARDRRPKRERLRELAAVDAAAAFVDLRICDAAMGSGHFLVSLVDYLAAEVLQAISAAPAMIAWADEDAPYRSPLSRSIEELRARIEAQAAANGWIVRPEQLDDRHLVRRIILKRVIYGVDLNPMAVELAKLSLWLHSFTVGAPLSFLDHHLRAGDSLFGEFAAPVERDLTERFGLATSGHAGIARRSASEMLRIESLSDADLSEVHESADAFEAMEQMTAPWRAFLSLYHAARWLRDDNPVQKIAVAALFGGNFGDPVAIASGTPLRAPKGDAVELRSGRMRVPAKDAFAAASTFVQAARDLAGRRNFLHWEAAFPNVWSEWERAEPFGGFDAVIGNPPWDRMKMQDVEWFAARIPAIAMAQRASDRKRMIADLRRIGDPVALDYDDASHTAERAIAVATGQGPFATRAESLALDSRDYPLLSGGDINVYALFIERARRLVRPGGIVGLLVPSGIAGDKGASLFFRGISTTGRLGALLDFENGRRAEGPFFPEVHRSFKFCALIFGGRERVFEAATCAFFQQDAKLAEANAFALTPQDFGAVNPNTGTAPVFRTQRDADITRNIYSRHNVLVDRSAGTPRAVWPIRYSTMFHMTNDSDKFSTEAELVASGAYKVRSGHWEKAGGRWVPLYEGKMVQAYDHRAASVIVNSANLHRPGQPETASADQKMDPAWAPKPQFWVDASDVTLPLALHYALAFKEITAATNARTMIATMIPRVGSSNKLPLLLPDELPKTGSTELYGQQSALLLANLGSICLDYVCRQKLQGATLNLYIIEQLPVISQAGFCRSFGSKTAEQIIRDDVLHLTYTAHDMKSFARDQGYNGPPFAWDEEDRLRRRARLDAVFFHLYGIDAETAEYILSTFPIVRREEEQRYGTFRSRTLILATMAALAAGNPDADVAG